MVNLHGISGALAIRNRQRAPVKKGPKKGGRFRRSLPSTSPQSLPVGIHEGKGATSPPRGGLPSSQWPIAEIRDDGLSEEEEVGARVPLSSHELSLALRWCCPRGVYVFLWESLASPLFRFPFQSFNHFIFFRHDSSEQRVPCFSLSKLFPEHPFFFIFFSSCFIYISGCLVANIVLFKVSRNAFSNLFRPLNVQECTDVGAKNSHPCASSQLLWTTKLK